MDPYDPYQIPKWVKWLNANPLIRAIVRARAKKVGPQYCSACGKVITRHAVFALNGPHTRGKYHPECYPGGHPFGNLTDTVPPRT